MASINVNTSGQIGGVHNVHETTGVSHTTAPGGSGGEVVVPDVPRQAAQSGVAMLTFQALLGSIDNKLLKLHGNADTSVLVAEVAALIDQTSKKVAEDNVKNQTAQKQAHNAEVKEKLAEAAKQRAEAEEAKRKAEKSSSLAKIFGWIAKAMSYLAAAVSIVALTLTPGGQPAAIALAALLAVSIANDITQSETGKGFLGHLVAACGGGDMGAMIGDMVFSVAVAAVSVAAAWKGASAIGTKATEMAKLAAKEGGEEVAKSVVKESTTRIVSGMARVTAGVGGATQVTAGGMNIDKTVKQKEADDTMVKTTRQDADVKRMQATTALLQQNIDELLNILMNVSKKPAEILDSAMESMLDTSRTLAKSKLTA